MDNFLPVDEHTRAIVICFNGHSDDLNSSHFEEITKAVFRVAKNMSEFCLKSHNLNKSQKHLVYRIDFRFRSVFNDKWN